MSWALQLRRRPPSSNDRANKLVRKFGLHVALGWASGVATLRGATPSTVFSNRHVSWIPKVAAVVAWQYGLHEEYENLRVPTHRRAMLGRRRRASDAAVAPRFDGGAGLCSSIRSMVASRACTFSLQGQKVWVIG